MRNATFVTVAFDEPTGIRLSVRTQRDGNRVVKLSLIVSLGGKVLSTTNDADVAMGAFHRAIERQQSHEGK
mgnify:CR=1 FL=1